MGRETTFASIGKIEYAPAHTEWSSVRCVGSETLAAGYMSANAGGTRQLRCGRLIPVTCHTWKVVVALSW